MNKKSSIKLRKLPCVMLLYLMGFFAQIWQTHRNITLQRENRSGEECL